MTIQAVVAGSVLFAAPVAAEAAAGDLWVGARLCFRLEPYGSRSNLGVQGCDNAVSSHHPADL